MPSSSSAFFVRLTTTTPCIPPLSERAADETMAVSAPDAKDTAIVAVVVESDGGDALEPACPCAAVPVHASESSPLLRPAEVPSVVAAPDRSRQHLVVAMCTVFLFIVEVSVFITEPPTQQIMEDIICRDRYPDHVLRAPARDPRCKNTDVQQTLAMVRSWSASAEMLVRTCLALGACFPSRRRR